MRTAKRIGAFVFAAFVPTAIVAGSLLSKTVPQPESRYAILTFDLSILGFAGIWAWRLAHGQKGWREASLGAWLIAAIATIAVMMLRDHVGGEQLAELSGYSVSQAGLNALCFRFLAFAFQDSAGEGKLSPIVRA